MFTYQAAYKYVEDGWVYARVDDFPGVSSQGKGLADAREMLSDALVGMAETLLSEGRPLPLPNPDAEPDAEEEMDRREEIYLALTAGHRLTVHARPVAEAASLPVRSPVPDVGQPADAPHPAPARAAA